MHEFCEKKYFVDFISIFFLFFIDLIRLKKKTVLFLLLQCGIVVFAIVVSAVICEDVAEKLSDQKPGATNAEGSVKEKRAVFTYASPYVYHSSPVIVHHAAPIYHPAPIVHSARIVSAPIVSASLVSAPIVHHSVVATHAVHPVVSHSVISHAPLVAVHHFKRR